MSLGGAGGGILGGPSKIGEAAPFVLVAATWTEIVLQQSLATLNPRPYPRTRWSIFCDKALYLAQANHGLTARGDVYALPVNPAAPVPGSRGPGYSYLAAATYLVIEAERYGENSLWVFDAAGGGIVTVTNISWTPYDNGP